jgi:hypothetical protein
MVDPRIKVMVSALWVEAQHGRIDDDWACGFIMDMAARMKLDRPFTDAQVAKIEQLFEKY